MDEFASIFREQTAKLLQELVTAEILADAEAGKNQPTLWEALEDAGLASAMVGEEVQGSGLHASVGGQLIQLAGYHNLPVPLAETMIGRAIWTRAGGEPVSGMLSLAPESNLRLEGDADHLIISGTLRRVPWADAASHILANIQSSEGPALLLLPRSSYRVEPGRNLANEPRETVHLDRTVALTTRHMRSLHGTSQLDMLLAGAFVRSQQMVGAMRRCLELAIQYANERRQFGKPIGRFQAVQHMLADAAGQCAAADAAASFAASAWGTGSFGLAAAIAKSRAGEAAGRIAEICHQVHGAMGFTHEHPLHYSTRRLWSWRDEFGSEAVWQKRIGEEICTGGGEALWPLLVSMRASGANMSEVHP